MVLSRTWAKRATVNTDNIGYTSPIGPPHRGGMSVCLQDGPSGLFGLQAVCGACTAFVRQPVSRPNGGCTPCLVGQSPLYGSQTYRSERMGGRPGPRSQHREQMTAPLLFVVGPKVATYRVQMRSPLLFEVGAEGGHIGSK
mgnify:CR=1 FL=1